jgi:dTMP kinase
LMLFYIQINHSFFSTDIIGVFIIFITFEGIDGVGKSTQARLLAATLNLFGHRSLLTHEPGGTDFGMKVRQLIKTEKNLSTYSQFHLIESQRDHHVTNVILPAIADNANVICDRFIDTSLVYQNSHMYYEDWLDYLWEYRVTPDLTFLMYTDDVSSIKNRMVARSGVEMDHFDNASIEKLIQMQQLFFMLTNEFPRIVPINTDRPIEVIAADIYERVRSRLEDAIHTEET